MRGRAAKLCDSNVSVLNCRNPKLLVQLKLRFSEQLYLAYLSDSTQYVPVLIPSSGDCD